MIVKATFQVGLITSALGRLRKFEVKRVFKNLRKPMHADQKDHRDRMRGPRGPWAPLAATTRARYAREGKRRNRRILARLPSARVVKITEKALTMTSPVKWSRAHFDGPTRVGRGAIVPQRQFWWISKPFLKQARREFTRAMWMRWTGQRYR